LIICVYEDRKDHEMPLQLLLLSLEQHCPQIPVYLFYPPASPAFSHWLLSRIQVTLCTKPLENANGWNVKPRAILRLFDLGYDDVCWIDSDIIVTKDFSYLFKGANDQTIFVTEESLWGFNYDRKHALWNKFNDSGALRASLWGFKVQRPLKFTLNTAVLRVTLAHRALLERWNELLQSEVYKEAQKTYWQERPIHMFTDLDVFTALLASQQFANFPIKILRRGKEILQCMALTGFSLFERARILVRGFPIFIHSQASKPWNVPDNVHVVQLGAYVRAVYLDLSPYTLIAKTYRHQLNGNTAWTQPHFRLSRVLRALGFWCIPLVGLPIAVVADLIQLWNRVAVHARRSRRSA
jgi:hypothetical protein